MTITNVLLNNHFHYIHHSLNNSTLLLGYYNIFNIIINIIDYDNDMITIINLNTYKFSYNNDNNNKHYY